MQAAGLDPASCLTDTITYQEGMLVIQDRNNNQKGKIKLVKPDFLLPDITSLAGRQRTLLRPMSYAKCLTLFRGLLKSGLDMATATIPADRIANITMHSCKVTLLAAARQLDVSEEHRADQGHHQRDSHQQSVRLYSRDDVWGALKCQGTLLRALADGWRPLSAQARGAQRPLQEPEFTVPPLASDDLYARKPSDLPRLILIPCYYSNESFEPPETLHVVSKKDGTASASDSGAAESSSCSDPSDFEDSSLPAPFRGAESDPCGTPGQFSPLFLVNFVSGTCHCAVPATALCDPRKCLVHTNEAGIVLSLKTACTTFVEGCTVQLETIEGTQLCLRKGCARLW